MYVWKKACKTYCLKFYQSLLASNNKSRCFCYYSQLYTQYCFSVWSGNDNVNSANDSKTTQLDANGGRYPIWLASNLRPPPILFFSLCLIQYTKARPHKKIGMTGEQLSHQVDVRWTWGWGQHSSNILDFIFLSALTWQNPKCYGNQDKLVNQQGLVFSNNVFVLVNQLILISITFGVISSIPFTLSLPDQTL